MRQLIDSFMELLRESVRTGAAGDLVGAYDKLWVVRNFIKAVEDETMVRTTYTPGWGEGLDELWDQAVEVENTLQSLAGGAVGVVTEQLRRLAESILGEGYVRERGEDAWWIYRGGLPARESRLVALWLAENGIGEGREALLSGWWRYGPGVRVDLLVHGAGWVRSVLEALDGEAVVSRALAEPDERVGDYMRNLWRVGVGGIYNDIGSLHAAARRLAGAARR